MSKAGRAYTQHSYHALVGRQNPHNKHRCEKRNGEVSDIPYDSLGICANVSPKSLFRAQCRSYMISKPSLRNMDKPKTPG